MLGISITNCAKDFRVAMLFTIFSAIRCLITASISMTVTAVCGAGANDISYDDS
jgi:hypothetical protein